MILPICYVVLCRKEASLRAERSTFLGSEHNQSTRSEQSLARTFRRVLYLFGMFYMHIFERSTPQSNEAICLVATMRDIGATRGLLESSGRSSFETFTCIEELKLRDGALRCGERRILLYHLGQVFSILPSILPVCAL